MKEKMETAKLIITFFRLLFSGGFKESLRTVFEKIKGSEDWAKDVTLYSDKFKRYENGKTEILLGSIVTKLREKQWDSNSISNVSKIYRELVHNSLDHGIQNMSTGILKIDSELTSNYVRLKIADNGAGFDLVKELKKQNAYSRSGENINGLSQVFRLCSTLSAYNDGEFQTVVTIYNKGQEPLHITKLREVNILHIRGDITLDSEEWKNKIDTITKLHKGEKLILNFGESTVFRQTRSLRNLIDPLMEEKKYKIAVVGAENLDTLEREHLRKNFYLFETGINAMTFLETGKIHENYNSGFDDLENEFGE